MIIHKYLGGRVRRWRYRRGLTNSWAIAAAFGRVQFNVHVHQHTGWLPDRWVIQPTFSYDRKRK